jgi:transcriptional regulator
MHPNRSFHETDERALAERVAESPLAVVIAPAPDGRLRVAHAPALADFDAKGARLRFHLAGANPCAEAVRARGRVLLVFTGPNAYVSPDWYGAPDQVPTWNYVSVEAEGAATALDRGGTTRLLDDLSAFFEARLAPKPPWTRAKMSGGAFERMLMAIAGFEMRPERFEGVAKLGQTKPAEARAAVAAALGDHPIAALMQGADRR